MVSPHSWWQVCSLSWRELSSLQRELPEHEDYVSLYSSFSPPPTGLLLSSDVPTAPELQVRSLWRFGVTWPLSSDRCGSTLSPPFTCACDADCGYFNDCCQDFSTSCQPQVGSPGSHCRQYQSQFRPSLHFIETTNTIISNVSVSNNWVPVSPHSLLRLLQVRQGREPGPADLPGLQVSHPVRLHSTGRSPLSDARPQTCHWPSQQDLVQGTLWGLKVWIATNTECFIQYTEILIPDKFSTVVFNIPFVRRRLLILTLCILYLYLARSYEEHFHPVVDGPSWERCSNLWFWVPWQEVFIVLEQLLHEMLEGWRLISLWANLAWKPDKKVDLKSLKRILTAVWKMSAASILMLWWWQ